MPTQNSVLFLFYQIC